MLKVFKELDGRPEKTEDSPPKELFLRNTCEHCHVLSWSIRLENQDTCAICRMVVIVMQPHYDCLGPMSKIGCEVVIDADDLKGNHIGLALYDKKPKYANEVIKAYARYDTKSPTAFEESPTFLHGSSAIHLHLEAFCEFANRRSTLLRADIVV